MHFNIIIDISPKINSTFGGNYPNINVIKITLDDRQ
jgi:hypothetical protein